MPIKLMPLPFPRHGLAPDMSEETVDYHYGKHHQGYVDKLNALISDTSLAGAKLEDIILGSKDAPESADLFNNAAQVWNHNFFWNSLSPEGGELPDGPLQEKIEADFGGRKAFDDAFTDAATGQFGSGWAWLVLKDGTLSVIATPNAVPPFVNGFEPLITCDVWEHAYYLDHRNDRGAFVEIFLEKLVNWDFAAKRFESLGR